MATFPMHRFELTAEGDLARGGLRRMLRELGFDGWTETYARGYWHGTRQDVTVFSVLAVADGADAFAHVAGELAAALKAAHAFRPAGEVFQLVYLGRADVTEVTA
jgi:hypothetical protein